MRRQRRRGVFHRERESSRVHPTGRVPNEPRCDLPLSPTSSSPAAQSSQGLTGYVVPLFIKSSRVWGIPGTPLVVLLYSGGSSHNRRRAGTSCTQSKSGVSFPDNNRVPCLPLRLRVSVTRSLHPRCEIEDRSLRRQIRHFGAVTSAVETETSPTHLQSKPQSWMTSPGLGESALLRRAMKPNSRKGLKG